MNSTYINSVLRTKFGKEANGRPKFRIVFANDEFEWRKGTFVDFDEHGNFLREVTETRYVPKYPTPVHRGKWLLEKSLEGLPSEMSRELPNHNGYECIWVFRDVLNKKQNEYQEPILKAVLLLVRWFYEGQIHARKNPKTEADWDAAELAEREEERKLFLEMVQRSGIEDSLHLGEGISMANLEVSK
jgi:hypothetical protein